MITRPDVDALLAGPLGQWLHEQATVREQARELAKARWWKALIIGAPLLLFLWILVPQWAQFNMFVTFAAATVGYAWGNAPRARAIRTVKEGINTAIARALGLEYAINVEPGRPFQLGCDFRLLPSYDRSRFEDCWSGDLGTRHFHLHEATLQERRNSGKNTRYVTVFRGSIITIDFARDFHGTTLVERAGRHRSLFGGQKDSVKLGDRQLDYVDMVHPGFEDEFCVYSSDQVEARYLVHPEYVERLMAVQQAFAGKDIRALFEGGDMIIVVETDNLFESGSIEARDDRQRMERTVEQFASLADLAQTLNERER
ncbi:MAG: DUF3137 domain-containing protein [Novosphingobium sp.]|nr:DUF3137 domain-containing protein [Novosphingobium sp.]